MSGKVFHRDAAVFCRHDAQLDAETLLELTIQNEAGDEVKLVEHDIVALVPLHGVNDEILAIARRIQQRHFVFVGAEELGEPRARSRFCLPATAAASQEHFLVGVRRDRIASGP
jgi:hypothetical protein